MLSYIVAERRREIGVRVALGARPQTILGGVVVHGLKRAAVGLGIGLAAALSLTRLIEALLFGVPPSDAVTFVSVAVAISFFATVASFVPAYRAMRIDPIVTMKRSSGSGGVTKRCERPAESNKAVRRRSEFGRLVSGTARSGSN